MDEGWDLISTVRNNGGNDPDIEYNRDYGMTIRPNNQKTIGVDFSCLSYKLDLVSIEYYIIYIFRDSDEYINKRLVINSLAKFSAINYDNGNLIKSFTASSVNGEININHAYLSEGIYLSTSIK